MRRLIVPVLACSALLGACGSDDDATGTPEGVPASGGGAGGQQVDMVDIKFQPERIKVNVGQTVTWVNKDNVPHNVVNKREGRQPKSELFNEGGKYSWTPTEPGRVEYVCTIHPGMEGTVDVVGG